MGFLDDGVKAWQAEQFPAAPPQKFTVRFPQGEHRVLQSADDRWYTITDSGVLRIVTRPKNGPQTIEHYSPSAWESVSETTQTSAVPSPAQPEDESK